jgi:hypothetical protein
MLSDNIKHIINQTPPDNCGLHIDWSEIMGSEDLSLKKKAVHSKIIEGIFEQNT